MKGSASTDESVTAATEEGIDGVIASRLVSWQKIPKKQAAGRSKHQSIRFLSIFKYTKGLTLLGILIRVRTPFH